MTTDEQPRRIEYMPLDGLKLDPRNPKSHSIETIDASVSRFGWIENITVDGRTGLVISGHGRVKTLLARRQRGEDPPEGVVAQEDGTWLVPVSVGWESTDDLEAVGALITLNRTTELGGWVDEALLTALDLLREADDGLDGIGFTDEDVYVLDHSLKAHTYVDKDAVPDQPEGDPVSHLGDVWDLGRHRLAVGSSVEQDVWDRLLDGDHGDAVWTDPPYGVDYSGGAKPRRAISGDAKPRRAISGDAKPVVTVPAVFDHLLARTVPGAAWWVTVPPGPSQVQFEQWLVDRDVYRQGLVWVKNNATFGRTDYHYKHEPILYGRTPSNGTGRYGRLTPGGQGWWGDHRQTSVIEIDRPASSAEHPTMKPIALIERCLQAGSPPGGLVLDPFAGSGSTLIACESSGRRARCIELDLHYADTICRRFQTVTGIKPIRDGVPHDFT